MLVDCITGLPIFELTTTADVSDSTVALDILSQTNSFLPVIECTFIADKAYDVKAIYNTVKDVYEGDCVIPLNKRNTKNPKKLSSGHPICEAGLAMNKDESDKNTAVPSEIQNPAVVPVIIKTGTMARKTKAAQNTLPFPMITDFPLTVTVSLLRKFILSEPKLNDTMLVSNRPVRNGFGFTVKILQKISIPLLILLCLPLLMLLLSLNRIILFVA